MNKDDIKFIREKDFTFLKEIGQGALGKTVLLKDEDLNGTYNTPRNLNKFF